MACTWARVSSLRCVLGVVADLLCLDSTATAIGEGAVSWTGVCVTTWWVEFSARLMMENTSPKMMSALRVVVENG